MLDGGSKSNLFSQAGFGVDQVEVVGGDLKADAQLPLEQQSGVLLFGSRKPPRVLLVCLSL